MQAQAGALVLARPQVRPILPAPAGQKGSVQGISRLLGGDEVAVQGPGNQLGQCLDGPGDGGLGHAEQLADGGLGQVVTQVDQCRPQRPDHPEDRRDGMQRLALSDPLGQLGELADTQPGGMLHGDGSFPCGGFVWRQESSDRNEPSPLQNTPPLKPHDYTPE